jgi:hypothetical protein
MKIRRLITLAALLLPAAAPAINVAPGDLLLSFFQLSRSDPADPNSEFTSVASNTYIFNLGPASTWRETSATTTLVANLNADLEAQFGEGWADDAGLRVCITGMVGPSDATVNGDPARTLYWGQSMAAFAPNQTAPWSLSASQRGSASTSAKTFFDAMNGKPSTTNQVNGAAVNSSANSSVTSFLPPIRTTSFGISVSPVTNFGPGNIGSAGSYTVEAGLEVFRILHSTTGADLTVNKTPGNAGTGTATLIGTFTIANNGDVRYDTPPNVVQSPFQAWLAANSLTGPSAAADADPDKDGVANAIEFLVGGNPNNSSDGNKRPDITAAAGGFFELSFRRTDASISLTPTVEHDTDLLGTWTTATNGASGVSVNVATDFYDSTTDKVTYRIPISGPRNFARVRLSTN